LKVRRTEYPRPDFERSNWINLNGEWQFEIDAGKSGVEKGWSSGKEFSRRIIVPFPPESSLSGIGVKDFMESVWYRRFFDVHAEWLDGRVLLHFGAVDYEARVWVNGSQVGYHKGGYTPFTCDISDVVKFEDNELVVWARDECRSGLQPTGKQCPRLKSYNCLFSRVTGIWQTVWLEYVPRVYISSFRLRTDPYNGRVFISVHVRGNRDKYGLSLTAYDGKESVAEAKGSFYRSPAEIVLTIPCCRMWSPEDPYLYRLSLQLTDEEGFVDTVKSYFGLRDIRIVGNRILLNNKTRFLRLVMDQGYYPDGIYTAPSDEALKHDIEIAKAMGFNGARLHQKVFEPRFLYWADRLGYLVVEEFPDWGADLSKSSARDALLEEWIEVLKRDINHPCVIIWTPFNEQEFLLDSPIADFVRRVVRITKLFDPTRPVIDSSGGTHVKTDIYDIHEPADTAEKMRSHYSDLEGPPERAFRWLRRWYERYEPGRFAPYKGQPVIPSEFGFLWVNSEEPKKGSWGYGSKFRCTSVEELVSRYKALTEALLFNPNVAGFCYTELYDIEQETMGLYTYDRRPNVKPEIIYSINRQEAAIAKRAGIK